MDLEATFDSEVVIDQIVEEDDESFEEIEEELLSAGDIEYAGKSLDQYEEEFTVKIPALPCTSIEMGNAISKLNNSYQIAYNCFNRLFVVCSKAEALYKAEKYSLCTKYISDLKAAGVAKGKIPALATVEALVINNTKNKKLLRLLDTYKKYSWVKDWFEHHRNKLQTAMTIGSKLLYQTASSDRMNNLEVGRGHGLS